MSGVFEMIFPRQTIRHYDEKTNTEYCIPKKTSDFDKAQMRVCAKMGYKNTITETPSLLIYKNAKNKDGSNNSTNVIRKKLTADLRKTLPSVLKSKMTRQGI